MSYNLALILAAALPALIVFVLRANAAMVFLGLCLGAVLVEYVGTVAGDMIGLFTPHISPVSRGVIDIVLLVLPALLITVFTTLKIKGTFKVVLNIVPAVATGLLLVVLAVPLLAPDLASVLQQQKAWRIIDNAESLIIGVGALASIVFLWLQARTRPKEDKKKH